MVQKWILFENMMFFSMKLSMEFCKKMSMKFGSRVWFFIPFMCWSFCNLLATNPVTKIFLLWLPHPLPRCIICFSKWYFSFSWSLLKQSSQQDETDHQPSFVLVTRLLSNHANANVASEVYYALLYFINRCVFIPSYLKLKMTPWRIDAFMNVKILRMCADPHDGSSDKIMIFRYRVYTV